MKPDVPESLLRLFVYGTLKPGHSNHSRISAWVRGAEFGTVFGVLVDLGSFPGLLAGNGLVRGAFLLVEPEALIVADHIEGCGRDRDHALYQRRKTPVRLDDGRTISAWVYWYARPVAEPDGSAHLVVGESDGLPVFAWPGSGPIHSRPT